ncbi:hypothetical protein ACRRTK_009190 [Alexandromys fortis]
MAEVEQKKKRTYRGVDLDQLLNMSCEPPTQLYSARQRRHLNRDLPAAEAALAAQAPEKSQEGGSAHEKPEMVKTHLQDVIILPEVVGSMVGVYNGETFNQVEIKLEMIGAAWESSPLPTSL